MFFPRQKRWMLKKCLTIKRSWQSYFINRTVSALMWQETDFMVGPAEVPWVARWRMVVTGWLFTCTECVPLLVIKPDFSIWYQPDAMKFTTATMEKQCKYSPPLSHIWPIMWHNLLCLRLLTVGGARGEFKGRIRINRGDLLSRSSVWPGNLVLPPVEIKSILLIYNNAWIF